MKLGVFKNLHFPYLPPTFSTLGELNIHIYDETSPEKEYAINIKAFPHVWGAYFRIALAQGASIDLNTPSHTPGNFVAHLRNLNKHHIYLTKFPTICYP